jgi:proliferating cell nuclear antigen|tara:strand:+ start:173 stop:1018 length:846 start_codon:yes stop_codon:yes gene_type:complete
MVKIIELKTTQSSAIKILVDTLNSLLTDVNITFYPTNKFSENSDENSDSEKINKGGIVIKEVNKTITVLVYCKLDGFEEYYYNYHKNKLMIGIKLPNLLKCLKCMTHFDTMSWIIDDDDINKMILVLESTERNEKKIFKLNLMDLDDEKYEIEPVEFPYCITIPSQDFHKYCKDMASVMANKMDLQCTSNMIFLSGKSDIGSVDFQVGESIGGLQIDVNTDKHEIVQGIFELKYLTIFTKCTNLCNEVKLFLKNDYALIVKYQIAALGEIKLVLSPSDPES